MTSVQHFDNVCDEISQSVDTEMFEARRWDSNEGQFLKKFTSHLLDLFASRDDFTIQLLQTPKKDIAIFLVFIWSKPFANLYVRILPSEVRVWSSEANNNVPAANKPPISINVTDITYESVGEVVANALARITV